LPRHVLVSPGSRPAATAPSGSDGSGHPPSSLRGFRGRLIFHFMMNAYWEALDFELPPVDSPSPEASQGSDRGEKDGAWWRRWVDTSLDSPDDICSWIDAPAVRGPTYRVQPRSIAVLVVHAPG